MNKIELNQCRLDVERLRKASDRIVALQEAHDKAVSDLHFTLAQMQRIADWLKPNNVIEPEVARQHVLDILHMMKGWTK